MFVNNKGLTFGLRIKRKKLVEVVKELGGMVS
jgi:hypothetical protein